MYLFFDTETSDLPRRWNAPVTDTNNWPRLVQIAWIACDSDDEAIEPQTRLIQPEGFSIARGATEVHGITTEFAAAHGVPLRPVLDEFSTAVEGADVLVAHNIDFDARIMGCELIRAGLANVIDRKPQSCTMKEVDDFCKLPGKYGYKWPSLTELHKILFGQPLRGAHEATADCVACLKCFFALQRQGAI